MENLDIDIFEAIRQNNIDIVKRLLKNSADPNMQNENGNTLLNFASEHENFEIVTLLLKHGANPNIQDVDGWAPLLYACASDCNNFDIVKLLLEYGANSNIQEYEGLTPLYCACCHESFESVKLLLEHGADPNMRTSYDWTPLLRASFRRGNNYDILMILIDYGADCDIINKDHKTAFDYEGGDFIREYLKSKEHQIVLK